jgi:NifB/MoaA-like Fe-S oxidoreductase
MRIREQIQEDLNTTREWVRKFKEEAANYEVVAKKLEEELKESSMTLIPGHVYEEKVNKARYLILKNNQYMCLHWINGETADASVLRIGHKFTDLGILSEVLGRSTGYGFDGEPK